MFWERGRLARPQATRTGETPALPTVPAVPDQTPTQVSYTLSLGADGGIVQSG